MDSVQNVKGDQKPKSVSCSPEVHKQFKMFVVEKSDGSMQEWVDKLLTDGMARALSAEEDSGNKSAAAA